MIDDANCIGVARGMSRSNRAGGPPLARNDTLTPCLWRGGVALAESLVRQPADSLSLASSSIRIIASTVLELS